MEVASTLSYVGYLLRKPRASQNLSMRSWRVVALALWMIAVSSLIHAKQLAIVIDTANTTTNLSAADLNKIVNLKTHNWPDGKPVTIIMRDPAAPDMQLVLRRILNMTSEQARTFIQAHKGAIVIADSDDAVLRFVSSIRGAIGVVDLYSLTKDVTVVKIDGKLPIEQGYLLRGD
jgi:ABC-type phosphate transport system substrate-binding protein